MTTTITFESIQTGRSQFNATSAKVFRDTLAKWHTADFEIAEKCNKISDYISSRRGCITTNNDWLNDEKNSKDFAEIAKKKAQIEEYEADIKKASEELADFRKAQELRSKAGLALVVPSLYKAYAEYAADSENTELYRAYIVAIAQWLKNNGVEPKMDTCVAISSLVGTASRKNSAKNKFKTGKHNTVFTDKSFPSMFLGGLCDLLGNALPVHKFEYIPVSLREKKSK